MTEQEAKKYFKEKQIGSLKTYLADLPNKDSKEYKFIENQILEKINQLEGEVKQ